MARKRGEPEPPGEPEVDPATGKRLLESQIEKGKLLLEKRPLADDAYRQWELLTRNYLEKAFGRNSPNVSSVTDVGKYGAFPMSAGEGFWENHRAESLTTQITRLEGLVELLGTELQLRGGGLIVGHGDTWEVVGGSSSSAGPRPGPWHSMQRASSRLPAG